MGLGGGGGGGSCISIHEKKQGSEAAYYIYIHIYVLDYYFTTSCFSISSNFDCCLNVMCCGLQLVLWFHLLALLNLDYKASSGVHIKFLRENQSSFSFPATDGIPWVPADQLTKLTTTDQCQMQLFFLQNKTCLKLSLFCMRTDDWLKFHVKFQSIHVNITSTTHHFFSSKLVKLKKKKKKKKKKLVKLKTYM